MYTFHTLEVKQRPFDIISQLLSFSVNTHKLWKELRKQKTEEDYTKTTNNYTGFFIVYLWRLPFCASSQVDYIIEYSYSFSFRFYNSFLSVNRQII